MVSSCVSVLTCRMEPAATNPSSSFALQTTESRYLSNDCKHKNDSKESSKLSPSTATPQIHDELNTTKKEDAVSGESSAKKLRKFIFNDSQKVLLVKCVRTTDAHRALQGDHDRKYSEVRAAFLENIPKRVWQFQCKPSIETLRDKMRTMMYQRTKQNRENIAASCITEEVTEVQRLLDQLIEEKDDFDLSQAQERNSANAREQQLVEAGRVVQRMALERNRKQEEDKENFEPVDVQSQRRVKRKETTLSQGFSNWDKDVRKQLHDKNRLEERKVFLQEKELELRRQQWEEERKDRELSRDQNWKQLELLNALITQLKK